MNLYLIGYRGSGKSTVAPLIAKEITWNAIDADDLVESNTQQSISEIFASDGEAAFRELEHDVISTIVGKTNLVVSLGGGAPLFERNRDMIAKSGKTVWLFAESSVLWKRISTDNTSHDQRPNLTDEGGRTEVERLLLIRNPVYEACADYKIDVTSLSPEEVAERIVEWWNSDDKHRSGSH